MKELVIIQGASDLLKSQSWFNEEATPLFAQNQNVFVIPKERLKQFLATSGKTEALKMIAERLLQTTKVLAAEGNLEELKKMKETGVAHLELGIFVLKITGDKDPDTIEMLRITEELLAEVTTVVDGAIAKLTTP